MNKLTRTPKASILFLWYLLQKGDSKKLQIRALTNREVLVYLLYGYSLEMLLRDDIQIRLNEGKPITVEEREYYFSKLWLYIPIITGEDKKYYSRKWEEPTDYDYAQTWQQNMA